MPPAPASRLRAFLLGLMAAIVVEIVVDWNATFYEVSVLRQSLRQKGENYSEVLRQAATAAMLAYDWDELDRLSARLFDDPDVIYVRFTDVLGNTIFDHLRAELAQDGRDPVRERYRRSMDRDLHGIIHDPLRLQQEYAHSRHRDVIQVFSDAQAQVLRLFTSPSGTAQDSPRTMYQDRLGGEDGTLDRNVSYTVGAVTNELGEPFGAILIAFSHSSLNRSTRVKLLKGLVITVVFVVFIVVQNILSRRAQLRLRAFDHTLASARAMLDAWSPLPAEFPLSVTVQRTQVELGGVTCWGWSAGECHWLVLVEPVNVGMSGAIRALTLAQAAPVTLPARQAEGSAAAAWQAVMDGAVHGVPAGEPAPWVLVIRMQGAVAEVAGSSGWKALHGEGVWRPSAPAEDSQSLGQQPWKLTFSVPAAGWVGTATVAPGLSCAEAGAAAGKLKPGRADRFVVGLRT